MPSTTQLCVCPHRSLTGALFRNHIDLLDMMSLLGDAFIFARDAPSDANRSFMELSSTVCRRPIRAQRVPTRKPLRHPGRTHVHADWHSYCKAAGCP